MFNPFPFFLELSFLAPLLIRITLGLFFIFVGKTIMFNKRKEFSELFTNKKMPAPMVLSYLLAVATSLVGAFFLIGFMTQYAVIASIVLSIYFMRLLQNEVKILHHSYATYYFSILISLSLFILGAGPLAIDLPL